jgi:uroporphyrin-III C-methyltransferase
MGAGATPGVVYLVGAGPGAADLITLRGYRLLRTADAILHDALISPEVFADVRGDAHVLHVGKRGYCVGSTKQETIHDALVRLAREGKSVVRLKCGDPCVFGRGGEEAEALAEAGVRFEIVPGVTSALGVTAAANIPLTHRDVGQAVTFVTGHFDPDSPDCELDWPALARTPAVVFYMAVRHLAAIARTLTAHGMNPTTAAAVIENGTLPTERVTVGELATIAELAEAVGVQAPALVVVGEVVRYRERLANLACAHISQRPE